MTSQDFKILIQSLDAITKAIKGKDENSNTECINAFSRVLRGLNEAKEIDNFKELRDKVLEIRQIYLRIANYILDEKN